MSSYHQVTVFNLTDAHRAHSLKQLAMEQFSCTGIEEYSLDEPAVDALLGERSYSGGDLPIELLGEVDSIMHSRGFHYKFYFVEQDLPLAQSFLRIINQEYLCEAQLDTRDEQDWNAEWKKHYKPIWVDGGLLVLPEWVSDSDSKASWCLKINPGMGFGTGSHETTYLCLKKLIELLPKVPSRADVLDYGSGSGILGIAALMLISNSFADMVDIDPEAHLNCQQNMKLNSLDSSRARLFMVNERPNRSYPVVFANILQNILHNDRDYLINSTEPGGYLILSGLLRSQVSETLSFYLESEQVVLESEELKGDWGCIVLRRSR